MSVDADDSSAGRDASSFERLYARHHASLYRFLYRLAGARDRADDLFQETWLRIARHFTTLAATEDVQAWIFRVARNVFLSRRRSNAAERRGLERLRLQPEAAERGADHALAVREGGEALERAWRELSDDDRALLWLVAVEGLGQQQIAQVLGLGHAAVRQRVVRARARLAEALAGRAEAQVVTPRRRR